MLVYNEVNNVFETTITTVNKKVYSSRHEHFMYWITLNNYKLFARILSDTFICNGIDLLSCKNSLTFLRGVIFTHSTLCLRRVSVHGNMAEL